MQLTVLGNGGFGMAMAMVADAAGNQVRLWGHDAQYTKEMAQSRANPRYLPGIHLPESIRVTADAAQALKDTEVVLVAVPTQHIREVVSGMVDLLPKEVPLISLAKGLEQGTALRPSQVLADVLPNPHPIHVLSGPSHAEEVAKAKPTTVVLAGKDSKQLQELQEALGTKSFRIYSNQDLLGVELCAALKNVMAVAAGMADGLGLGDNAKAAILTRGIVEMSRYGVAEGAELSTFFGLAGIGDLAVTAFSQHGRNRAFGERIGGGESLDDILASTHKVAEGVWTSRVVQKRALELQVEMPLCQAVCDVLFDQKDLHSTVAALMVRDPKNEILN